MSEAPERIFAVIIDGKLEASVNPIRSPLAREYTVRADLLPVVKPLVWEIFGGSTWYAKSPFGRYSVWECGAGYYRPPDGFGGIKCDGPLSAAKAAAQADYEARSRANFDMIDPAKLIAKAVNAKLDEVLKAVTLQSYADYVEGKPLAYVDGHSDACTLLYKNILTMKEPE